jgi:hypothetical protein
MFELFFFETGKRCRVDHSQNNNDMQSSHKKLTIHIKKNINSLKKNDSINLPFILNPASLELIYLTLMFLLLISSMPIFSYGIYQSKIKFKKLQHNVSRLIRTDNSNTDTNNDEQTRFDLNQTNNKHKKISRISNNNMSPSSYESSSSSLSLNHTSFSLQSTTTATDNNKQTDLFLPNNTLDNEDDDYETTTSTTNDYSSKLIKHNSFYSVYKPFKNHVFALIILLIICIYSAILVYDYICLYQLTSDVLLFWASLSHIIFVLWYILLWLILTFKTKWLFVFSHTFKLNYWNFKTKIDQQQQQQQQQDLSLLRSTNNNHVTSSCTATTQLATPRINGQPSV